MDNIVVLNAAQVGSGGQHRTPKQQVNYTVASARERLARYWMGMLKGSEFKVLNFVLDRTLPFGKSREIIPIRHFTDGVWTRAGDLVTVGTGLSRRSVITATHTLADMGLVKRVPSGIANGQVHDSYWFELDFKMLWRTDMLRTPKRLRAKNLQEGGAKSAREGVQKLHTESIEVEAMEKTTSFGGVAAATTARLRKPKRSRPQRQQHDTVEEAYDAATSRARAKRKEKIDKAAGKLTLPNFKRAWEAAHARHFQNIAPQSISVRGFAIIRSSLKTYRLSGSFYDFIDWFFDNYQAVKTSKRLSWVNKNADYPPLPSVPTPDTLTRYFKHFVAAHEEFAHAGYNERAVDWKAKADAAAKEAKERAEEARRTDEHNRKLKARIAALERDKRALEQKTAPISQVDEEDYVHPARRQRRNNIIPPDDVEEQEE